MKVFDFTDGIKGRLLADIPRPDSMQGYPVVTDPTTGKQMFLKPRNPLQMGRGTEFAVHRAVGRRCEPDETYRPETYGVQAILFCTGQWNAGTDVTWQWAAIGTDEWLARATSYGFFEDA